MSSIAISPGDLETLRSVPAQIATLASTATRTLEAVRAGADGGNPVSALLAGLSSLSEQAGRLPSIEPLLGPVRQLTASLPRGALADLTAIGGEIDRVLGMLGPLKDTVLSGKIDQSLTDAIARTLDSTGSLFQPGGEVGRVLGDLEDALGVFRAVVEWQHRPPRPDEVAELIARGLAGVPPNLLAAPAAALDAALAPLASIPPAGSDLELWRQAPQRRQQVWKTLGTRVGASGSVDWGQLEIDLHAESRALLDARAARDRLLAATLAGLGRIDLRALGQVGASLAGVPKVRDLRFSPIVAGLRRQLESTAQDLESWAPTEDEARALVRRLVERLLAYLEQSPIGRVRALLVDFQQRLLLAIEALPFRDLARDAEQVLRRVAAAIDVVDPRIVRKPVHDFFAGLEGKLDEVSGEIVRGALGSLTRDVETTITQINTEVGRLRDTLQGLVAQLKTFAAAAAPALAAVVQSRGAITATLESFDLTESAAGVVENLHTLRDILQSLDLSALPDPALSALRTGATVLREIDVAGTVNPELEKALAAVDPTALIEEVAQGIAGLTEQLAMLDPASLSRELDAPVNALLDALSKLGPESFRALVNAALNPLEDAVSRLDVSQLFAPITQLHAELTARVDAVLDPERIFAPLDALFQPLVDIVDGLRPSRFVDKLTSHGDSFAESLSRPGGPPASVVSAGLKAAMPAGPEAEDDLFGFRVGDLLIPLIDLHRLFAQAFDRLDDQLLASVGRQVQSGLHGALQALNPASVSLRVGTSLAGVRAEFEPAQVSRRLGEAVQAYHTTAAAIGAAARSNLPAAEAAIATRVLALLGPVHPLQLMPDPAQFEGVRGASAQLEARVDLRSLRSAFPGLAQVDRLIPDFLKTPDLGAGTIRQALRDLDPGPLRDDINQIFDRLGRRIVGLKDVLLAALAELGRVVEEFLLPITPGNLVSLADRLHAGLKQQILELRPNRFKDEVTLLFDTVKRQLAAFNPALIVQELNALRDHLIQKIRGLVTQLLPDPALFAETQARLAALKPSVLLAPLTQTLAPVTQALATLDPQALFQPLIDAIARVRTDLPQTIAAVEAALDEVLAVFPEGGPAGASVQVTTG